MARELLADTGSIFVQISDENLHRVRCVMDEVFGPDNFISHDCVHEDSVAQSRRVRPCDLRIPPLVCAEDAGKCAHSIPPSLGVKPGERRAATLIPTAMLQIGEVVLDEERDDIAISPEGCAFFSSITTDFSQSEVRKRRCQLHSRERRSRPSRKLLENESQECDAS